MLKKIILILTLTLFLTTSIGAHCINVSMKSSRALDCANGGVADNESVPGWCIYEIDPRDTLNELAVIEIFSGGRYGADRHQYLNFERPGELWIWVNRETTPIYITCHNSNMTQANDGSVGWQKLAWVQTIAIASDGLPQQEPEDDIAKAMRGIASDTSNLDNLAGIDNLDTVLNKDEVTTNYENKNTTTNDEVLWLGVILIILGGIYAIKEIVNIWRT